MTDEHIQKLLADPGGRQMLETELRNTEGARMRIEDQAARTTDQQHVRMLTAHAVQLAADAARIRSALASASRAAAGKATGGIGDVFKIMAGQVGRMAQ